MRSQNMRFASLFSGCGGFDLGFAAKGFQASGAYDCDSDALANYRANVHGPSFEADLRKGVPNDADLKGIDVVIAGPPCQGFSTAGKRLLDDERNHLLTLTGDLAKRIQPKVMVVENVSGALSGEHARYWKELDANMRLAGYRTHTIRCQATNLGMAQQRKRVMLFAWRTGKDICFEAPKIPANNLRNVLAGVTGKANHFPRRLKPNSTEWLIARKIRPGQKLSNVRGGPNAVATWDIPEVFGIVTEQERTILELLRRLRRQERQRDSGDADPVSFDRLESALGARFHNFIEILIKKGFVRRVENGVDLACTFNGKFRRLAWSSPSCTVDTRFGSPRYFLHPSQQRGFTVREAARIQGFEDDYVFLGDENAQFRLIGNAVPPPLSKFAAGYASMLLQSAT